jgi:predicted alternative tryptophan synthase beta-subunit
VLRRRKQPRRNRLEFIKDRLEGKHSARVVAVEPSACPTLTKGEYKYDFGDTAEMTPLLKMYTLGTSIYRLLSMPEGFDIMATLLS